MIITEPLLPAKEGYTEQVDENGKHFYQPTQEQQEKEQQQKSYEELAAENANLKTQLAQSDDAALTLFEAQASTDEAILAIYQQIKGGTTT